MQNKCIGKLTQFVILRSGATKELKNKAVALRSFGGASG